MYIAHINEDTKQIQTIKEHSENVAMLCRKFAVPELKDLMYIIGILHDIGKYQSSFQKRIQGDNVRVEHSICGAIVAHNRYLNSIALIIEHCIAGHHSGLADTGFFNLYSRYSQSEIPRQNLCPRGILSAGYHSLGSGYGRCKRLRNDQSGNLGYDCRSGNRRGCRRLGIYGNYRFRGAARKI